MYPSFSGYKRRDMLIAAMLSFFLLLVCGTQLTRGMPSWAGDDFAAYISEGISLSNGTFDEQTVLNYTLHPSPLSTEATADGLVYVWGFPLLLSLAHRLVGFDLVTYSSFIFYKFPSLIAFALASGILYLYYRRFFSEKIAIFLSLLFSASTDLMNAVNFLNVDILFLCAFLFSLLIAECFFSSMHNRSCGICWLHAVILGVSFWFTHETRLNGSTLIIIVAISHIVRFSSERKHLSLRRIALHVFPYVIFLSLKLISESILLPATSNLSDVGNVTFTNIKDNIQYYCNLTKTYWNSLSGSPILPIWPLLCIFTFTGLLKDGFTRKNIHLSLLLIGTYLVLILLPYTQGLRYLFNILPVLLLFSAYGGLRVCTWLSKTLRISRMAQKRILSVLFVLILIPAYIPAIQSGITNLRSNAQITENDIYSSDSIDMYHYIQNHTDSEDIIAFQKPRALYLNTNRTSFSPYVNGHNLYDADYLLASTTFFPYTDVPIIENEAQNLIPVYENASFTLYELTKSN